MNARVLLALGCLITILQVSHQAGDPRLKQCSMKLVEQIHNLDWKQPPKCMDTKKLKNVVKSVEVFKGFYDSLPPQCKSKVITKNAKMCVDVITEKLKKHSDAMKASIIRAVNNFFGSSQGCIEEARRKFEHLDQYVLRGCQN